MNKWFGLSVAAALGGHALSACGSGTDDGADMSSASANGTLGPMGVPPGGTMPAATTPPGGTMPATPATNPTTPQTPATNPTMPATTDPVAMGPDVSACTTTYDGQNTDNSMAALDGAESIFFFGDGSTTACGDTSMPNQACMSGTAVPAGADYSAWGAGMGLQLAASDTGTPLDLAALQVTQVSFNVSGWTGRPVRVQIAQVNDPAIADAGANYEQNGFVAGGSMPMEITADGPVTIDLASFMLPEWTGVMDPTMMPAEDQVLDLTQVHSLQFQIANEPADPEATYAFCITDLQWLDAAGTPVDVPEPEAGAGGAGAGGGAGMAGMAGMAGTGGGMAGMGTGGGMAGMGGGMAGMGGGMGGMAGDGPSFAADIHPIFVDNCRPCHDIGQMSGMRSHAQDDVDAAYMSVIMAGAQELADRVSAGTMPPSGPLPQEDVDLIVAWVEAGTPE